MLGAPPPVGTGAGAGAVGGNAGGGSGGRTGPTESAGGGGGGGAAGGLGGGARGGAGGGDTGSACTSTRVWGGAGGAVRPEGAVVQAESDSAPNAIHAPSLALFIAALTLLRAPSTLGGRALRDTG